MNSFFCSSVPHWRMVGPTSVSPKKSARIGAPALANSSFEHDLLEQGEALAAVLGGPAGADPAALEERLGPALVELAALARRSSRSPARTSRRAGCSSSQARISTRNASASGG